MNRRALFQLGAGIVAGEAARRAYSFLTNNPLGSQFPVFDGLDAAELRPLEHAVITLNGGAWYANGWVLGDLIHVPFHENAAAIGRISHIDRLNGVVTLQVERYTT